MRFLTLCLILCWMLPTEAYAQFLMPRSMVANADQYVIHEVTPATITYQMPGWAQPETISRDVIDHANPLFPQGVSNVGKAVWVSDFDTADVPPIGDPETIDAILAEIDALAAERDALQAQLATIQADHQAEIAALQAQHQAEIAQVEQAQSDTLAAILAHIRSRR